MKSLLYVHDYGRVFLIKEEQLPYQSENEEFLCFLYGYSYLCE